jgi:hypothetical protein
MSCQKQTVTVDVPTTDNSTLGLLTQKQWQFDSLYDSYTSPGTGILEYARGTGSNMVNEDNIRDFYWKDGDADYIDNLGNFTTNTWTLDASDSTHLTLVTPGGTIYGKILKLDATHFTFHDSTNQALDVQVYKYLYGLNMRRKASSKRMLFCLKINRPLSQFQAFINNLKIILILHLN